jgi:hypothetical protein
MSEHVQWSFQPLSDSNSSWARWDDFNARTFNTPLLNSCFLAPALKHFGTGKEFMAFGTDASGLAAACLLEEGGPLLAQTFAAAQLPLCAWLQRPDLRFGDLAEPLTAQLSRSTLLTSFFSLDPRLLSIPTADPCVQSLVHITTGAIQFPASFDQYLQTRSKKAVANVERRIRKAAGEFGKPSLKIVASQAEVGCAIDAYADLESSSWKALGGTALSRGDAQTSFYCQVMEAFYERKIGRIYQLYFGDRLAAMELAVLHGSVAYMLKTSFDSDLRACSPGILLKWYLIQSLFEESPPLRRLEHYGPLNESQAPWITESREMRHANVYRHPLFASLHSISRRWRKPVPPHSPPTETS